MVLIFFGEYIVYMPIEYIKSLPDGSSLALWRIAEDERQLLNHLQLSDREFDELQAIRSEQGRVRSLAGRKALNCLFEEDVSECMKDEHGKPFVLGYEGYVSLSHSFDFAIAMAHPEFPVGVDIEIVQPKIRRIQGKFLRPSEIGFIDAQHDIHMLYACWCAKEAVFKWQGKKGISLKQHIEIQPFVLEERGHLNARLRYPGFDQVLKVGYENLGTYFLAYVCHPVTIRENFYAK